MNVLKRIPLLILLISTLVTLSQQLDEEDGGGVVSNKATDGQCQQAHSCTSPGPFRTCSCHPVCSYFGICCADAPAAPGNTINTELRQRLLLNKGFMCEKTLGDWVLVVSSCPSDAPKPLIDLCRKENAYPTRVTSNTTKLTYKNIYCGLCNGEKTYNMIAWQLNFHCPKLISTGITTPAPPIDPRLTAGKNLKELAGRCQLNETFPTVPPRNIEAHLRISNYFDSYSLCSRSPITTCSGSATQAQQQACMDGLNAFVNYGEHVYKNEDCLKCNIASEEIPANATCESCEEVKNGKCIHESHMDHSVLATFAVLVQPYPQRSTVICQKEDGSECGGQLRHLPECGPGQYIDYDTTTCMDLCPQDYILNDGVCDEDPLKCQENLDYDSFVSITDTGAVHLRGLTFKVNRTAKVSCFTCKTLASSETSTIEEIDGQLSYQGEMIPLNVRHKDVDDGITRVCVDGIQNKENNDILIQGYITTVFISVSILCILLFGIAYLLFKRMRNIPGKIIFGHMFSLLMAYVFFLARHLSEDSHSACYAVAVLINYFFISAFIFTLIYAGFIVHSLGFLDFESSVTKWTAVRMWLLGLTAPLVVIIPGILLDNLGTSEYAPAYGSNTKTCFIGNGKGIRLYFIAPICLCLFIDLCLYLTIIIKLVRIAKDTQQVRSNHREKITLSIKLLAILGFLWIFALLACVTEITIFDTIFVCTCTLQGCAGFVVFVCNKATIKDLKARYNKHKAKTLSASSGAKPLPLKVVDTASTDLSLKRGLLSPRKDSDSPESYKGQRL